MKRLILAVMIVLMMSSVVCAEDMFKAQDNDARKYTKTFREDMTAAFKEEGISIISSDAKSIPDKNIKTLIWFETEKGYYYYEMTICYVNTDKELTNKYSISYPEDNK